MERRFSIHMIKASLKEPKLTLEELPVVMPEFFEIMGLRTTDTVAVTVPGQEEILRFNYKGNEASEFPSLLQMVKNLTGSAARTAGALASGKKVQVPQEIYDQRLAACGRCDQWNAEKKRCRICGCSTTYKLWLAREECPHDDGPRWKKWEPPKDQ